METNNYKNWSTLYCSHSKVCVMHVENTKASFGYQTKLQKHGLELQEVPKNIRIGMSWISRSASCLSAYVHECNAQDPDTCRSFLKERDFHPGQIWRHKVGDIRCPDHQQKKKHVIRTLKYRLQYYTSYKPSWAAV